MSGIVHTLFFFAVALGVLITIHEFGHFWVARKLGVKVIRFSIGFGKSLWSYQQDPKSTEYIVAAVPLGGYVKMVDEREGDVDDEDLPYAFNRQSLPVRTAIVLAGPLFNLMLAVIIYWSIFLVGEEGVRPLLGPVESGTLAEKSGFMEGDEIISVDGTDTPTWEVAMSRLFIMAIDHGTIEIGIKTDDGRNIIRTLAVSAELQDHPEVLQKQLGFTPWQPSLPPVFDLVQEGESAALSGLQTGDRVVSADGVPIRTWSEWVELVRGKPEVDLQLIIERDGAQMPINLRPKAVETNEKIIGRIGATVRVPEHLFEQMTGKYQLGIVSGLQAAVIRTADYSLLTLKMIGRMIVGRASVENLSGPISIAQYAGQSASIGLTQFVKFLAIVSISLGVLNLLPIPILDGGHLLYFFIEAVKGSPVSEGVQLFGQKLGIALLISLMGLAFFLDIERLLA